MDVTVKNIRGIIIVADITIKVSRKMVIMVHGTCGQRRAVLKEGWGGRVTNNLFFFFFGRILKF
jgi:hypothetical protein